MFSYVQNDVENCLKSGSSVEFKYIRNKGHSLFRSQMLFEGDFFC